MSISSNQAEQASSSVPLADPFILLHEGRYYAYGTHVKEGIEVWCSDDLLNWKQMPQLALHMDDSYAEKWFWAPEIYKIGDKFQMYYSADRHCCVAIADSPLGPFKQVKKEPIWDAEMTLDNTLFVDDDGKPYMFFVRWNDEGNDYWSECIYSAEMTADCQHILPETIKMVARPEQKWELQKSLINEGPFIVKHKGIYYMTYSGNGSQYHEYGIGCAVAENINGPWKKLEDNPILSTDGKIFGPGHHSFFVDKQGDLRIVFHAHYSHDVVFPRCMYIGRVQFVPTPGVIDRLVISNDYISCQIDK